MTWDETCDWWKRYLESRNFDEIDDPHVRWNCAKLLTMNSFPLTTSRVPKIPPALREFACVEVRHVCDHISPNAWAMHSLSEALGWAIALRDWGLCKLVLDAFPIDSSEGRPDFKQIPDVVLNAFKKIYKTTVEQAWENVMKNNV